MTNEPSPRPWHTANFINGIEDANNGKVAAIEEELNERKTNEQKTSHPVEV